jgi:tRNA-Thr(GGU) m(6)t(6)A37 methyltransferase TsaA
VTGESMSPRTIGVVRSSLRSLEDAPRQARGAPPATLVVAPAFQEALLGIRVGQRLDVLTWLHQADRSVLQVHPMSDRSLPLAGVFATRSPDRPTPIGIHPVEVLSISGTEIGVSALEAIDGTPIIDIKCSL